MLLLVVGLAALTQAAVPDDGGTTTVGARKFATNLRDCNGPVAFSSAGAAELGGEHKLGYRRVLADKSVGWGRENGDFTCYCPGLYHFTFAGSTKTADARLVLKKKTAAATGSEWESIVSTPGGGGSNSALLDMEVGDTAAIWLEGGGALAPEADSAAPSTTFSAVRIAKKQ